MIYEFPNASDSLRQGDIFVGVPRVELSLREIPIVTEDGQQRVCSWNEVVQDGREVAAVLALRSVAAIVATQDCDTQHSRDITLCEIRRFQDVDRKSAQATTAKAWKNILTQHARINQKWFYLPPDDRVGFSEKMAVDFMISLRVPREDLEEIRHLRKARLNDLADEHFRERISEFFRRYPYDEWYALNQQELAAYSQEYPGIQPFPWQISPVPK